MSIATELSRIQTDRNTIRTKLVELGLAASTDNLDKLATAVEEITNRGAVSATVQEGDTYTIPAGYHNGSGTVSGVAGGGNYALQSKTATPTKKQQSITPDSGYYGLSDVTVAAIPSNYQDVSSTTATADDVRSGKVFVTATGVVTAGSLGTIAPITKTLTVSETTYPILEGYHNGEGSVQIVLEGKAVTPSTAEQSVTPTEGKVLKEVIVKAIPWQYQDITGTTATAGDVLAGKTFINANGVATEGTMPNNGSVAATMDGLTTTYVDVPPGMTTGGRISLTNDIETALAAI